MVVNEIIWMSHRLQRFGAGIKLLLFSKCHTAARSESMFPEKIFERNLLWMRSAALNWMSSNYPQATGTGKRNLLIITKFYSVMRLTQKQAHATVLCNRCVLYKQSHSTHCISCGNDGGSVATVLWHHTAALWRRAAAVGRLTSPRQRHYVQTFSTT